MPDNVEGCALMYKFTKLLLIGCLAFIVGAPIVSYESGYRPAPCCVTDHGLVYQVIQFATLRSVRWNLYYNATNTHYLGQIVVKCDYYKVGMYVDVSRNIQKPLPLAGTPLNPIANGTGFVNLVGGPSEC